LTCQERIDKQIGGFFSLIGVTAFYGGFVELGTSRMVARPFLRPALLDSWEEIRAIFTDRDKRLLRRLL